MNSLNKIEKKIQLRAKTLKETNRKLSISRNENEIEKLEKRKVIIADEIKQLRDKKEEYIKEYPKNILEVLIKERVKKQSLTYDELYGYVPDNIVSANMIDEIVTLLAERNIKVVEKRISAEKHPATIYYETQEYERNVDDQLKELFKSAFEEKDYRSDINKTSDNGVKIAPLRLPRIADVSPKLANGDQSLILFKVRIKEKTFIGSNQMEIIKPAIIEDTQPNIEDNGIEPSDIPKIYSKGKFSNDRRLSLFAKIAGDRSEEIVIKYLKETLSPHERDTIKWISKAGETPGWDITYFDSGNRIVAIEVKGTTGNFFPNIEITANEWNAANELGDRYWIYLVTSCFTKNPKIQRLNDPALLKESGVLRVTPMLWKIEMLSPETC